MADYRIQLGVDLNTKEIDNQVNKYKSPSKVKVGVELNTNDINTMINAYKPTKRIEINSKLNTDGIESAISKYQVKNPVKVNLKLDTSGIESALGAYTTKTPIRVDVQLNKSTITQQIKEYSNENQYITVKAKLDDGAISEAIKSYQSKTPIRVNLDLNYADIESKISGYEVRSPLRVKIKIDKTDINNQIKSYEGSNHLISVKAKLDNGAITEAIRTYKAKTPITVAMQLDKAAIDQQIAAYKARHPSIELSVDPKINTSSINKQIKSYFAKTPIYLQVALADNDIEKKIRAYESNTPIIVNAKLNDASLTKQIATYKTKAPIELNAKLNVADIDKVISSYKAKTPIKVNVKLDGSSINQQISTYKTSTPLAIAANLDESSIDKQISAYRTKTPVLVDLKLNANNINEEIRKYGAGKPIPVDIKLSNKGLSEQIRSYFSKTPIPLNVRLDTKDINKAISAYKATTPITVGARLDSGDIAKQLNAYTKASISVNVKLDVQRINEQIRAFSTKSSVGVGVKLNTKNINEQIRGFKTKSLIRVGVKLDTRNINEQIRGFKTKSLIRVGVKLDTRNINEQIRGFNTRTSIVVNASLNTRNIQNQINNLRQQIQSLGNVRINLGNIGTGAGGGVRNNEIAAQTQAFNDLMRVVRELNSLRVNLNGLSDGTPEASRLIQTLRLQIEQLDNQYVNLLNTFNAQGIQFTAEQWRQLDEVMDRTGRTVSRVQSQMADKSATQAQTQAYRDLLAVSKEIGSLEVNILKLKNQGGNIGQIELLENKLRELQIAYQQMVTSMQTPLTADQWSSLYTKITHTQEELARLKAAHADARAEMAKGISIPSEQAKVEALRTNIGKLAMETDEVRAGFQRVEQALVALQNARGDDELIEAQQKLQNELKETTALYKILLAAEQAEGNTDSFATKKEAAMMRLDGLFERGSQASRRFASDVEILQKELNECGNVQGINRLNDKISVLDKKIKNSGLQTKKFGTRLKEQFSQYSSYLSVYTVFMYAGQALRSMFEQVKSIDSGMTELKKVTDETQASYNNFLSNAAIRAQELGTTIDGLINSTADFARLGYGFKESQELAEVANIYAVVGDEIEGVEEATQSLVSTLAAFKSQANGLSDGDFAMSIVDKMNEVSNNYAISSGGIGDALQRSASSMAAANNTLDETIAMIAAANTVAQNPEKVGNAFKTMSMRIRGAVTELEEAGESTDGMAESTAKLRQEIKALSGVDIMLDSKTFKSTYQIMDELSVKWENLSDIAQASIIELVAGKHQGNVFASLMSNFDIARDALKTSLDSSGSAMREHEKWSESLEARLNKLKAGWQSFSQTFLSSDLLKGGIETLKVLLDLLDKFVKNFGLLGAIGLPTGIITLFKSFKNIHNFTNLRIFGALPEELKSASLGFKALRLDVKAFMKTPAGIATAVGLITAAVGLLYNHIKNVKEAAAELRQETIKASDDFLNASTSFEKAYIKYSGRTNLTAEEEAELESAINGTVEALDDKSSALQSVVDSSNDYVSSLEHVANAEIRAAERAAKAKQDAAKTNIQEAAMGWSEFDGSEVGIYLGSDSNDSRMGKAIDIAEKLGSEYIQTSTLGARGYAVQTKSIELSTDASTEQIIAYYDFLLEYKEKLEDAGLSDPDLGDTAVYDKVVAQIDKMSEAVETYVDGTYEVAKAQYQLRNGIPKTTEEYLAMRKAILNSDDIKNLSVDTKKFIADSLDNEYKLSFDLSDAEVQAQKLIGVLDEYGESEASQMETFLNVRTAVNNNECTVGEYLSQFDDIANMTVGWSDKAKEELNTTFGLDTDSVKQQYDEAYKYLKRNYIDKLSPTDRIKNLDTSGLSRFETETYREIETEKFYEEAEAKVNDFISGLTQKELSALISIQTEIDWENTNFEDVMPLIEEQVKIDEALNFEANIEVDTTALEAFNTALAESTSAMGLSSESIDSLQAKYADLDSYNPDTLFEKTANGVKLNREEVEKLEEEYNDLKKADVQKHIDTLTEAYNDNAAKIDECTNAAERAKLISENDAYKSRIEELARYQAQLEGVTGAYQEWIDAQNGSENYDGYESIATSREDIQSEIDRGFIGNKSKKYIDLLSGEDLNGKDIDAYADAWDRLDDKVTGAGYSINDFFTVNDDGDITATGIDRFFKSIRTDFENEIYKTNEETGEKYYDFSRKNLEAIQKEYGIGIEAIELLLEAAVDAGYDIDWGGILDGIDLNTSDFETLVFYAEKAQKELNKLEGYEDLSFNFATTSVEDATTEIEKAQNAYSKLINKDGKVNLEAEGAEEMRVVLSTLLVQRQQLEDSEIALNISTSGLEDSQAKAVAWVQDFRTKYKNLEIAISTGEGIEEAKAELKTVSDSLGELDGDTAEVAAKLVLGENTETDGEGFKTQVANAIDAVGEPDIDVGFKLGETAIADLNSQLLTNFTVDATAKITNVDESQLETVETNGMVNWDENTDGVSKSFEANGTVNWDDNTNNLEKSFTATGSVTWTSGNNVKVKVISEANGTANANGTTNASGRAFKQGNWGIKGSGTALVGELGMETLVRGGHFYTIGNTGAEFIQYRQGDIIFNHKQTEELFKNGKITSGGGRGKMFADGSAFVDGSYPTVGRAFNGWQATASESNFAKNRRNSVTGETYSSKSSSKSSSSDNEFEETFDWIEVAISRVERAIDRLDQKASRTWASWSSRNSNLRSEISKINDEIDLQNAAYDEYMAAANAVGLSASWKKKVQNGEVDIETIKDEVLAEKIKSYQQWYEKALACKDAILDLEDAEADKYNELFDNVVSKYDGILQVYEHTEPMLNEYISQAEARGHVVSKDYYQSLINNERNNISKLEKERAELIKARDEAVASGAIKIGSEDWNNMSAEIDSVTQSIEEGKTAILEYANSMREIDWEVFDMLQERIFNVSKEADFFIDLMSNDKLYDDNGKLTDEGMATMGLHGQNYNTYMAQADMYADEIADLDAQIAKDPYNQDLINRRQELLDLQQEAILAAEDEKQAIRDMVEEGIQLELEALQERIDKYNEAMESAKDLYDYQKKVKEQTEEIASLEKQMAAYAGDNSEEARARVQELKVSLEEAKENLEETEYERYISDQQQLLDELYLEYEEILNMRLDNVDALMTDMIAQINANATSISTTLSEKADAVGYTMTESMKTIWDGNTVDTNNVITTYGEKFTTAQTTTNNALDAINVKLQSMMAALNKDAKKNTKSTKTTSSTKDTTKKTTTTTTKKDTTKKTTTTKAIKVGGKINAKGAQIYDNKGDTSGERQLYRNDPIYKVLKTDGNWIQVRWHKLSSGVTGWFKKGDVKAYKNGAKRIASNDLAWTQENRKQEFILRPSDGAVLTPVAKNDKIFNAYASNNLWDMANTPAEFIRDNLNLSAASAPDNSKAQNTYTQYLDKVVFSLPNVHNYDEFLSALQKDKNFEKLIESMTIDRVAGKSFLAKNKSIR